MHDKESQMSEEQARASDDTGEAEDERLKEASSEEEPTCALCGHPIAQDDIICPNCGVSLVAG
jgi:rubrerythrin